MHEDDISHLKPIKLAGMELYRIRKGDFRIIFHKEKAKYIIDSIRIRNEKTYKL
jgi:mRNA-degrading endonuclease RelE of RelBE toxin-antitoxin system